MARDPRSVQGTAAKSQEPIDLPWERSEPRGPARPIDPPWVEDIREAPQGPIDPPWVPEPGEEPEPGIDDPGWSFETEDDLRAALESRLEKEPDWVWATPSRTSAPPGPIDPPWIDDAPLAASRPPEPIDPGWDAARADAPPGRFDPDWAAPLSEGPTAFDATAFEPDWVAADDGAAASEADRTAAEQEEAAFRTTPAPSGSALPEEGVAAPVAARPGVLTRSRAAWRRLLGRPRAREASAPGAVSPERRALIDNAMRIRTETREALGEDTVRALYRSIMGRDPDEPR